MEALTSEVQTITEFSINSLSSILENKLSGGSNLSGPFRILNQPNNIIIPIIIIACLILLFFIVEYKEVENKCDNEEKVIGELQELN